MPRGSSKDGALGAYETKRDFAATPEPKGRRGSKAPALPGYGLFVVQKHAARSLHYDFRLEHAGVLLSWAVPKGPSLDPRQRRLAVQVEDHPVAYASFKGVIPAGNYGAGKVEIWDRGRWLPHDDVDEGLRRGRLDFRLLGGKLDGEWHLVRMEKETRSSTSSPKSNWLLFRGKEERDAREREPASRLAAPGALESTALKSTASKSTTRKSRARKPTGGMSTPANPTSTESTVASSTAAAQLFALATLVEAVPTGDGWLHETKWDGYRLLAAKEGGSVRLWSRSGADWTVRLPEVAAAIARLPAESAILDGELVALAASKSSFQSLQAALAEEPGARLRAALRFVAFDLLTLDGEDLRPLPLDERKKRLARLLGALPARSIVRPSPHQIGHGSERLAAACARGLEGIVCKRADAPYRSGRGRDWLKVKCHLRQELAIVGFTDSRTESRRELGALLLAVADDHGDFVYAGRVGTGFDQRTRGDLLRRLRALAIASSPFAAPVPGFAAVHWVRPELVAEVQFSEWTAEGRLRHPSFVGLREDKAARDVRRERPAARDVRRERPAARDVRRDRPAARDVRRDRPAARDVRREQPAEASRRPLPTTAKGSSRASDGTVEGVKISHPERLLFAEAELTKLDLARYFSAVWPYLEPHLRDRPLAFLRCPEGARNACFFQKHWPGELAGVTPVDISEAGERQPPQAKIESASGLVGLVQNGVIEFHLWGVREPNLERPDRLVFDLDPGPGVAWPAVVEGARLLRSLLAEVGLQSFALLSGGKGVHVVAPVLPERDWTTIKAFAAAIAGAVVAASPDRYVAQAAKSMRQGRIFIDYLRNGRGATAIAPFSPRARAGGPVATPISWEELARSTPDRWTIATLPGRLRKLQRSGSEPWPDYFRLEQSITDAALARVGLEPPPGRGRKKAKKARKPAMKNVTKAAPTTRKAVRRRSVRTN